MEHNIMFRRQMAPDRVDERLLFLAADDDGDEPPLRRKVQDPRAEFLEATKSRPVLQHPLDTSDRRIHGNSETGPSGLPEIAQNPVDLPLDLLPDIALRVYPLDLIHLSRTNKTLRGALMSKESRKIWMTALGRAVDLPPCPSDMSEPLYAALVFDHHCFGCGITNAFWVDYALRIRMCERCYGENVIEGTEMLKSIPKKYREMVAQVALMLIPPAWHQQIGWFHGTNPLSHLTQDFYRRSELEAVLRLFWPLPEPHDIVGLKPLVRERVNYVLQRHSHAFLVHMWDRVGLASPNNKQRLISYSAAYFREDAILTLRGPDWDERTSAQDPVVFEYLNSEVPEPRLDAPTLPEVKSFSQFVAETDILEQHGKVVYARRIAGRYAQVAEWYPRVLAAHFTRPQWDHAVFPNAFDGARLWEELVLQNYVLALIDKDTVMGEQQLRDVTRGLGAYQKSVMASLAAAVTGGAEDHSDVDHQKNGEDIISGEHAHDILLRLPTTLFRCEGCGDYPYAWPEINIHWQDKHPNESVWKSSQRRVYKAAVWEEGTEIGEKVVAVLREHGLGDGDRNTKHLDELIQGGRVFCMCGDPSMVSPDHGLNWAALIKHVSVHLTENACRTVRFARDESHADERGVVPIWIDDHNLSSCIKYIPDGADTSQAWKRVRADPNDRARISRLLGQCPQESRPVCCLCAELIPDDQKDSFLSLPECADAVVYHMQAKHGKEFQEKDVVFWENSVFVTA